MSGLGYNRLGGEGKDIADHYLNTYRYDSANDTYDRVADAPEPRCCGGDGVVDDLLILAGGFFGVAEDLGAVCEPTWVLNVSDLPDIRDLNLAKHKPAEADSELEGHQAVRAADGNLDTFWEPAERGATSHWWKLDLLTPANLGTAKVTRHSATPASAYILETSLNGVDWTAIQAQSAHRPSPRVEAWDLAGVTARFLRFRFPATAAAKSLGVREVELYGPQP